MASDTAPVMDAIAKEPTMYQRILVPVDGSPTSNQGLAEAVRLAKLSGARLRLIHVVNEMSLSTGFEFYTADIIGILKEGGEKIVGEAKARAAAAGVEAETCVLENFGSRVCDIVVGEALAWKADLIVIGSHGRHGIGRLFLGSDAEQILRRSPVPVLLVHGAAETNDAQTAAKGAGASSAVPA